MESDRFGKKIFQFNKMVCIVFQDSFCNVVKHLEYNLSLSEAKSNIFSSYSLTVAPKDYVAKMSDAAPFGAHHLLLSLGLWAGFKGIFWC